MNMFKLPLILPAPKLPSHISITAKWLSGEGAGSWFVIEEKENCKNYKITRFSPKGAIECEGIFKTDIKINLEKKYSLTYPSHCSKVTILQGINKISLKAFDA